MICRSADGFFCAKIFGFPGAEISSAEQLRKLIWRKLRSEGQPRAVFIGILNRGAMHMLGLRGISG
jgi:hypothetical protein